MLVKCMFSGSGGQGSALMAKLVCEGAMRENLKVVMTQTTALSSAAATPLLHHHFRRSIGSPIVENDATIAVALSHSPKLLVLDEATSGLDPSSGTRCWRSSTSSPGRRTTPS